MDAEQIREGVKCMQQGDKASSKGLFRKPDWDLASGYYNQAATAFKIAKSYDQAVQAYAKASEAYFKAENTHLAGKATESAAFILAQNLNNPQRAAEAYQRASNFFMTQGSTDRAAEQLQKAGRALENTDVNAAFDMYNKACLIYEQEDKARSATEIYKKATSLLVRNKRYDKALDMLKRQAVAFQKFTSRSHLYKTNLSILIVLFAIGDEVEAGKQFSNMCGNDAGFATSTEAELGDNFLRAFEQRDQALLENTARDQHITFLDNDIAKLARVLTVPGEVLSSVRPQQREMENRPLQYNNQAYQQQPTPPPPQQSPYHSPPPSNNYQQPDNRGYPSYQYEEDDEDSGLR